MTPKAKLAATPSPRLTLARSREPKSSAGETFPQQTNQCCNIILMSIDYRPSDQGSTLMTTLASRPVRRHNSAEFAVRPFQVVRRESLSCAISLSFSLFSGASTQSSSMGTKLRPRTSPPSWGRRRGLTAGCLCLGCHIEIYVSNRLSRHLACCSPDDPEALDSATTQCRKILTIGLSSLTTWYV